MKLLWQNKFDGYDLIGTSPLYYEGALIKEIHCLNYYLFDDSFNITDFSFAAEDGHILSCGKDGDTEEYEEKYSEENKPHHFECDDFVFGDYTISHHGEWGYSCKKNGQSLWKKSLKGYLYTDIVLHQNNIVFGTSGQGGHFYSLNIDTGEIVFDFNTKGTSKFFDKNNSYYFCSTDNNNTRIYRIDYSGNILENIELEGVYYDYECPINLCDDLLCIVTLKKKQQKKNELYSPVLNCIQL